MRTFSRLLALTASLSLALGILLLPLRPAQASGTTSGLYQVVATHNAVVFVNGLPAVPGAIYVDGDKVEIDATSGGYTVLSRASSGSVTSWTHAGSISGATFQAIWIGDD